MRLLGFQLLGFYYIVPSKEPETRKPPWTGTNPETMPATLGTRGLGVQGCRGLGFRTVGFGVWGLGFRTWDTLMEGGFGFRKEG